MTHYGDITKITASAVQTVNVIIGGSPCQDLSVAGKRAGLNGERSGLFMEQIRIIKEMRENDKRAGRSAEFIRPRFMVWENVPGAFSSNKGEDFRSVLEETARIADETAAVPRPPKGKWRTSGAILGDGWSIAWRVLDAQFWGVPQRRRRIALLADFGGQSAPEILFERKGVPRNIETCGAQGQRTAVDIKDSIDTANRAGAVYCIQGNCIDRADTAGGNGKGWTEDVSYTLTTVDRPAVCYDARENGDGKIVPTLTGGHESRITDYTALCIGNGQADQFKLSEKVGTLNCMHDQQAIITIDRAAFNQVENAQYDFEIADDGINSTLVSKGPSAICCAFQGQASESVGISASNTTSPTIQAKKQADVMTKIGICYIVRRLTPLECERLQGFPDGWTNIGEWTDSKGKVHKSSDGARYKALGNSIAIPPWTWILKRLSTYCGNDKTMASLFDGIGGFPLIWEQINGKGSCLWASEIEEFPIAVTKLRFGG